MLQHMADKIHEGMRECKKN
jgi:hypothetical protein